ncbi:MAG: HAMP domain-containing histidine kinase [Clostridia bacterium]|nr:HAMP domain-containing histidine kinase [Clostridia bacterium]
MNSLFARIMAVMLSVILILTAALSLLSYYSMREQRISARLDYLASEAADIADLAADMNSGGYPALLFQSSPQRYLNWKAQKVNDEFGAYIAVVDRWGRVMDNLQTAYSEDPDFVASLSGEEITAALTRVLAGEQIRIRSQSGQDPTFTVGVPFQQYETVTGAVLIQTKVQRIQSGMEDLLFQVIGVALLAMAVSAVAVWLVVRGMMKPLGSLTEAARAMGEGDFSLRVDESRGDAQLRQLSSTFNGMSERLQKMENSRREFVANVSHELRSPITSIRGFAEGMAEGIIPPEDHPRYLRLVAEESNRLSRLVEELLALSRLERDDATLEKTDFDMNEMLRRAIIRRIEDLDRKNIEVTCSFGTDPCCVRADEGRIEQVVINLLDNAIRFTEEGGNIRLTTEETADGVAVTVWDDGPPIPEEDRARVFERFFTSDRAHTSGKGTGLGLSICQQIMKMHGRTVALLDTEEGTAFRFELDRGEKTEKPAGKGAFPAGKTEEMPKEE